LSVLKNTGDRLEISFMAGTDFLTPVLWPGLNDNILWDGVLVFFTK